MTILILGFGLLVIIGELIMVKKMKQELSSKAKELGKIDITPHICHGDCTLLGTNGWVHVTTPRSDAPMVRYRVSDLDAWLDDHRVETRDARPAGKP